MGSVASTGASMVALGNVSARSITDITLSGGGSLTERMGPGWLGVMN